MSRYSLFLFSIIVSCLIVLFAQNTPEGPDQDWPLYGRQLNNQRFSTLEANQHSEY